MNFFKNIYFKALLLMMMFFALAHSIVMLIIFLVTKDFDIFHIFSIFDLNVIISNLEITPFNRIISFITLILSYLIILFNIKKLNKII